MSNDPRDMARNLEGSHTSEAIRARLEDGPEHSYLRDFVYGAVDGAVTTFAVVSGVAGAGLSTGVVLILGGANLVADGFSMAAGNFLATRTELAERRQARRTEELHIERYPDGEREEVRQIFARKGFKGRDLERAVDVITSDREQWVETMMREELGIAAAWVSPGKAALATFAAFVLVGFLPLASFVCEQISPGAVTRPFLWSSILTGIAFFGVGTFKGRFVEQRWYWAGLETLAVGSSAAGLAYLVGLLLEGIVPHG